jgi:beta-phosphoglucomutase-like phosphatase (HAD superfamily)
MTSTCQALIFDVDGTLADTEELHRQAFNLAFRACHLEWSWDVPLYGELLRVTGGKERIACYIARLGKRVAAERRALYALIPDIHHAKTRLYKELVTAGGLKLRSGVERLLVEARDARIRVAIASTTSPENIETLLISGLGPQGTTWFETIASGDIVANKKPAPDIYNVALRTLGVPAACAIAIEDSAIGVQSAKAAGLFTVVTPNVWTRDQDLRAADLQLESLESVSLERLVALHADALRGAHRCLESGLANA